MKTIKTLLLLLAISIFSCDNNDDAQTDPANPTDGFTHNGTFYETPNAYFEIDEDDDNGDGIPDHYNFFFLDARMADGDVSAGAPVDANEYVFSFSLSNFVFFSLRPDNNSSLGNSAPTAGNTYNGDTFHTTLNPTPDTVIVEDYIGSVQSLSTPYFINGLEYGNPTIDDSTNMQGSLSSTPTLTINAINIDSSNPSLSTIDVDYFYVNAVGETFTGHYEGTLGVIFD
ncbi:hypothetical protein Q4512_08355 [Oceanihabitans sp. 2_MG-2023]|uniref:hypothetical protein n=1 Tax=Oceanihabitans sp. 2_MG-2023 TaxID=3062661 RepID=UPI0026E3C4CC|nr:hypothetical protein [Oceanihabitans sp. 2_MG-2023]MDO6596925.1 hypothetical protein [Oceanihabitans sp. 2_MG-2023]